MEETMRFLLALQSSSKVFVLLRDAKAGGDTEVEFSDGEETLRLKPAPWNEHIVRVNAPGTLSDIEEEHLSFFFYRCVLCCPVDFPAGRVTVTVYIDGAPLGKAHLQYYSITEEVVSQLERMMDPVDFMCQVPLQFQIMLSPPK